jgi:4-aminobutyrate aminotransferase-like enzyme
MLALEFPEQTPGRAAAVLAAARDRGLVLLSCGLYGNVLRLHIPLTISDEDLELGLERLEDAIGDAGRG